MTSKGWMTNLVYGYLRANTIHQVFVSDLINIFLAYFLVYIEKPIRELFNQNGIKLCVPQLEEDAKLIKNQYQIPETEPDSSDDDYYEQSKYLGELEEMEKWENKCMFFTAIIYI